MKILFISFYFEPDLSAGSFRNTSLFKALKKQIKDSDSIEVITTQPNRYGSYNIKATEFEEQDNISIRRISIPEHKNGILSQINAFKSFYFQTIRLIKKRDYDVVYASSSRLFSAFLGARIANRKKAKLYLDIRDIFRETILDIYKNPVLRTGLNILLSPIEKYTFNSANHINLVSQGFANYFKKFKTNYSYFTNGIDEVFLNQKDVLSQSHNGHKKTILYAGNIGEGQGLHIIIPELAEKLSNTHHFKIIGDGGVKHKLTAEIEKRNLKNICFSPPVNRNDLIEEYKNADYLFMHLNKHKAFESVLPSKLFEYATFDKPIIAGVGGYAAEFLKENMVNALIFEPGNAAMLLDQLKSYTYQNIKRDAFIAKYARRQINTEMAKSILSI